ncbi:DUF58 domain-containing protein [Acidiluteibacter ferrifornacis]|uniref:DUF58 domain-containing protein n=1 Tax=Acidiluteibacter ferrifornacis TaxID=2692424 RepID=A0A6N9NHS5_9FLAO|nr:DUF58 domain-containing protein [Acidiluteibacter ferrifornacis]NBG65389.1 DUF58 domain-containing protein [Acidiluteibacter ferrifornacis]
MALETINRALLQQYTHLELLAKQVVEGFITGLHKSPFHGFSVEFAEHRLYNSGESTKHIDWKLFGKTDKLFVKRYEEETNLRCQMVIDTSSSMYFPEKVDENSFNKIKFSIYAAAALMELLKKQRDAFGLSTFNEELDFHTANRSNIRHQRLIISELQRLLNEPTKNVKTATVNALHQIAEMVHKRSLIIIFSDMIDDTDQEEQLFNSLQHLKHNKHEVILFHVVDRNKELEFDFDNRPYRFVDLESGEEVKLNSTEVKEKYILEVQKREKALKLKCAQYGISYVDADINQGFNQILFPYLVKRSKMK